MVGEPWAIASATVRIFFFFNLYYSMILPISDLKDRVEILLIKCRGLIKLDKAQMRLTFKGKMELNRDVM